MSKKIAIISVTYNQNESLKCFINSIKSQTNPNWVLYIIHDGYNEDLENDLKINGYLNDKVKFISHPERTSNYGHKLRKWSLENLELYDYVLLTNGDNYYTPNMVDEVLKHDSDFIYFSCVHNHANKNNHNQSSYGFMDSKLKESNIDMGCVVVKSEISKNVGFNHISYAADWEYFNEILLRNPTVSKIDKILFVHN